MKETVNIFCFGRTPSDGNCKLWILVNPWTQELRGGGRGDENKEEEIVTDDYKKRKLNMLKHFFLMYSMQQQIRDSKTHVKW